MDLIEMAKHRKHQKDLDVTATELVDRQEASDAARSTLVQLCRDFKKNTSQEVLEVVTPLLKRFQTEVDSLSKRSRVAEAAFLAAYKKLAHIKVPSPSLRKQAMRPPQSEAHSPPNSLPDQNHEQPPDLTIQQLRDQVAQDTIALQISPDRLLELQRQFADKERLLQESQTALCHKLQQAEHNISQLQSALEQTQSELLKANSNTNGSRSDELEMLMTDLDRTNHRAVTAEHESARRRHSSSTSPPPKAEMDNPSVPRTTLQIELATKDKEISQLVEDIRRLQSTVDSLKESSASQIAQLEKMLSEKSRIIQELEEKLDHQRDYEDLKRELRNLKMMEDSDNADTNEDADVLYDKGRTPPSTRRPSADSPSQGALPATRCLQNVEAFGSLLGEEIVSNFSRMMKTEPSASPPATPKSMDAESTEPSTPTKTPSDDGCGEPVSIERLQECLRQNMDRYASEALNTGNISRVVRELLSVHNVGQRLFAKFVLGLSQGTVSELLSKPKPWDKLTEKGRDSYRKMHAWASDEACVAMLKALVPKKGKESNVNSFRQEDIAAEERIAQILSEAQQAMITPKKERSPVPMIQMSHQNGSSSNADDSHGDSDGDGDNNSSSGHNGAQNLSSSTRDVKRTRKYENDDIPQEMVVRIYQEELAKLMGQRVEESFRQQQYERTHEEIRQALSIYHQELSRLSQLALTPGHEFTRFGAAALPGALLNGAFPGLSLGPESRGPRGNDPTDAMRHHGGAAHSPPGGGGGGGGVLNVLPDGPGAPGVEDLGSSPLQRMQSITNSLLSQNAAPPMPTSNQRQAKAVLPPITQQQFDQYNNLNTEDIVKKVKEQLSQYSISQRLFGENVLGLSQGSVSDLLARPKPWHMLTQKGREPFIRMKIFLEDENAVHKLVASQYKIAPEKLMRTSGFTAATSPLAATSSKLPPSNPRSRDLPSPHHHQRNNCDSSGSPHLSKGGFNATGTEVALMQQDCPGGLPPRSLYQHPPSSPSLGRKGPHQPHPPSARALSYMQPSVYEMAALTTDLDTQSITAKIKETLMAHNIGQKIFGEAVLGLSQGSVSELLSKPKPWHMLSIKGREPFIRMQLWLNDPHNVEKLQVIKNERREANKRRRTHIDLDMTAARPLEQPPPPSSLPHGTSPSLTFPFAAPSSPYPAAKKPRVLFSDEQKEALRLAFSMDPYPSTATIEFLAGELNLSVRTITNWFHNHRMRLKQHVVSPNPDDPPRQPDILANANRDGAAFDPTLFRNLLLQRLTDLHSGEKSAVGSGSYGTYNSYSPSSSSALGNEDMTLDLSMSGQNSQGTRRGHATSSAGDRTPSELNEEEDSNLSQEDTPPTTAAESSDRDSLHDDSARQSLNSHSRRRKPAMPKWVDPGLSPDSEDNEDVDDGNNNADDSENGIINGVCVRQTDFGIRSSSSHETVRVDPVPAHDARRRTSEATTRGDDFEDEEEGALELCTTKEKNSREEGQHRMREENIRRLEQQLEREDANDDWEF
ncbi:homeobox protein cut-like isoform X3 [Ornithodoros turicata]|uniref:homeobox protein cut-like isoform X3 n=1 Tax=Ornithodoros turicata TaxID=34597 RepID=UPI003138E75A